MDESMKQVIDTASVATMVGTLGALLPPISALFTIIWLAIRIWETDNVKTFIAKKRKRDSKGRFVKEDSDD